MTAPISAHRWDLHNCGVHIECKPMPLGARADTPDTCPTAGKVTYLHAHDYDGPLVCGCD